MAKTKSKPSVPYKYKTRVLKEQEEPPTPPCPEGWHETDGKCVKDEPVTEQEHECSEGEHWSEAEGKCVKDAPVTEQGAPAPITDETPIEQPEALPAPPLECGDGFHLEDGACVPDDVVPAQEPEPEMPPTSTAETALTIKSAPAGKLPPLLKFYEPCSPELRRCVDDLIAGGTPEDSAWAICKKQIGETAPTLPTNLYDADQSINTRLTNAIIASYARDCKLLETANQLNHSMASFMTYVVALPKLINAALKESYDTQREDARKAYVELGKLRASDTAIKEYMMKRLSQLATTQSKLQQSLIIEAQKLITTAKNLKEHMDGKTRDFEKLLALADKNAADLTSHNKTLETRNKELEQQQAEAEKKKVTETAKLAERIDNLEAKQRGQYKGANKPLDSQAGDGNDELGAASPYT